MNKRREQVLLLLKTIVIETLKDVPANIYLFGSWARNEEKRTSDIDIAVDSKIEIPIKKWTDLREKIEESTLPYRVDIVDLSKASEELIEKINKEGILWRDYKRESKVQTKH